MPVFFYFYKNRDVGMSEITESKWYMRDKEGILTRTEDKKEAPDGLWEKCPKCKTALTSHNLLEHKYTCKNCNYHFRIGSKSYFSLLFDGDEYEVLFTKLHPGDPLKFQDTKKYTDRVKSSIQKTQLDEAINVATGKVGGHEMVICCMDFKFIGGSMGSVMGEKISRAIDYCIENGKALVVISRSGGARMMEGALSLMQMAKVSAKLNLLADAKLPYFSVLTDPTTGGVTASFAMLGDFNIAEPNALIGFAGPRVIKETIGKDLPEGFQSSEFVKDHGFLDLIVDRKDLKEKLVTLVSVLA